MLLERSRLVLRIVLLASVVTLGLLAAPRAEAGPASKFYMPTVTWKEWELEFRGGLLDWPNASANHAQQYVAAVGYGLLPRWFSEFAVSYVRMPGGGSVISEFEWENVFQLTEIGEHWMDVGVFAEVAHDRQEGKNEIVIGPMLQKEWGCSQFNLNLLFKQVLGAKVPAVAPGPGSTEFKYAWQWIWHTRNALLQPGMQGFGSIGHFGNLYNKSSMLGPAFFGRASLGGGRGFRYNAALLFGTTGSVADRTLRFELEYEFF